MRDLFGYLAECLVFLVMTMLVCYLVLMFVSMVIKLFVR